MKYTLSIKNRKSKLRYNPNEKTQVLYFLHGLREMTVFIKNIEDRRWFIKAVLTHICEVEALSFSRRPLNAYLVLFV